MNRKHILAAAVIFSIAVFSGTASLAETKAAAPEAKAASDKITYTECTVSDVFTKKATLAGKNIAIKGSVVKVSSCIMGTNWYHIKDGTGSAGTDDLVATSGDTARVGDQVVVRGVLATDVDFGSGYKYAVIMKDSQVTAK